MQLSLPKDRCQGQNDHGWLGRQHWWSWLCPNVGLQPLPTFSGKSRSHVQRRQQVSVPGSSSTLARVNERWHRLEAAQSWSGSPGIGRWCGAGGGLWDWPKSALPTLRPRLRLPGSVISSLPARPCLHLAPWLPHEAPASLSHLQELPLLVVLHVRWLGYCWQRQPGLGGVPSRRCLPGLGGSRKTMGPLSRCGPP